MAPGVQAGSCKTPLAPCRAWQRPAAGEGWTALCGGSVASRPPGSETVVEVGAVDVADAPVAVVVAVDVDVGAAVVSTGEPVAPHPTASKVRAESTAARRVRTQVRAQQWFIGSPRIASDSRTPAAGAVGSPTAGDLLQELGVPHRLHSTRPHWGAHPPILPHATAGRPGFRQRQQFPPATGYRGCWCARTGRAPGTAAPPSGCADRHAGAPNCPNGPAPGCGYSPRSGGPHGTRR